MGVFKIETKDSEAIFLPADFAGVSAKLYKKTLIYMPHYEKKTILAFQFLIDVGGGDATSLIRRSRLSLLMSKL